MNNTRIRLADNGYSSILFASLLIVEIVCLRLAGAVDRFCGIADVSPAELDPYPLKCLVVKHPGERPDTICNICNPVAKGVANNM